MYELKLLAPQDSVESLSDVLEALEALSVSVEDADAHTPAEQALFGEPDMPAPQAGWTRSRVSALFGSKALAEEVAAQLPDMDLFDGASVQSITALEDQDWVRLTQSQFTPVEITPSLWIVPTWHEPPAQAQVFLRLDPGLAFGTGTHPTRILQQFLPVWIALIATFALSLRFKRHLGLFGKLFDSPVGMIGLALVLFWVFKAFWSIHARPNSEFT